MHLPILLTYNSKNKIENDTRLKEEDSTDAVEFISAPKFIGILMLVNRIDRLQEIKSFKMNFRDSALADN